VGEGTSSIREEIEETRARVGEDVEALSYKTDVGARLDDYVTEKKHAVTSKVTGATGAVTSTVSKAVPGSGPPRERLRSMQHTAERNPLGLAVGGAAVGFLAGLLLPSTRIEDEHLGDLATKVKDTAAEAGQEALDRGKDVAQSAIETAREEGKEQSRELASELSDRVQQEAQQGSQTRPGA
jgi:hypothetical protein